MVDFGSGSVNADHGSESPHASSSNGPSHQRREEDEGTSEPPSNDLQHNLSTNEARTSSSEEPRTSVRRSSRPHIPPKRLEDYVLMSTEGEDIDLPDDNEPMNYKEAKTKKEWVTAMKQQKGWEIHHLDVKIAFLHGELKEDVYVIQPEGFEVPGKEENVYKLAKALYGLRQAPRAWNTKLNGILKDMKFDRCSKEQAVYRRKDQEKLLLIAVYVDDLFVTEVSQQDACILLKQEGYATKILEETGMMQCNPAQVPMEPGLKLTKDGDEPEIDPTWFRRIVGCLRYLLHTRPDLAYSVGVVSRYMQHPKESHGMAVKHILRYVRGTLNCGLKYNRGGKLEIVGYSDNSHNIDVDDGRSTTMHVFYLGKSPITWCSQKQSTVALSSCEAEFMAATAAACQAIWLQELLAELTGWEGQKVILKVDNWSAIALTNNPIFHGRSKHINTRYHFIRECIENDQVEVEYVAGEEQKADMLTKPLARIKFNEMKTLVRIKDLPGLIRKLGG
ncbi:hypothetical protein E3N88_16966 [Mikania micrantha]|uniref:Reverse transcriptase Ty1/copia-type domain-containing protein n=1 Tax=Mikania micrantha TaxID=192012 RepID=A0A5N6NS08_9ASTR|nr:hypothetical protein E3N88_16966 [Mikania micrantha]